MPTLPLNDRRSGPYIAGAAQTDFAATFPCFDPETIRVIRWRQNGAGKLVHLVMGLGDFSIIDQTDDGFTAHLLLPALAGDIYTVSSLTPPERDETFTGGAVRAASLEAQFNALQVQVQEVRRDLDRAQLAPMKESAPQIPARENRLATLRAWTDDGSQERTDLTVASFLATVSGLALLQADVATLQAQVAYLLSHIGVSGGGVVGGLDLRPYLAEIPQVQGEDPAAWVDCSAAIRQACLDAGVLKVPVDASRVRGQYFLDPASTVVLPEQTGWIGPPSAPNKLSYLNVGGVVTSANLNPGFSFVVDVHSAHRWVPKFAIQGFNVVDGMCFVGHGLLEDAVAMHAGTLASPTDHAPLVVTDHRHNTDGTLMAVGQVRKAGSIRFRNMRATGVMQFMYVGDPHPVEEPWAYVQDGAGAVVYQNVAGKQVAIGVTGSGLMSGCGDIRIDGFSGSPMKRCLATAQVTSGGLRVTNAQFIPPNWTGISQPKSGGVTGYALLLWFQRNGCFWELWHRGVGVGSDFTGLRGFRYGWKVRAGIGDGPLGQDTGKINAAKFTNIGVERVITLCDLDEFSYMHRVLFEGTGHFMDEDNLAGETGSVFQVRSHKDKAGAVSKALGVHIGRGVAVSLGDKYDFGGRIYKALSDGVTGEAGHEPVSTDPAATEVDGTVTWQYRGVGFIAFGANPFAEVDIRITCQEIAGRFWAGNVNDGHAIVDASGSTLRNWGQATGHHADAAIYNPSPITVFAWTKGRVFASAQSKKVFDVADLSRLHLGNLDFFGYDTTSDATATGQICPAMPADFFELLNCQAYDFLGDAGTDYDPDGDDEEEE